MDPQMLQALLQGLLGYLPPTDQGQTAPLPVPTGFTPPQSEFGPPPMMGTGIPANQPPAPPAGFGMLPPHPGDMSQFLDPWKRQSGAYPDLPPSFQDQVNRIKVDLPAQPGALGMIPQAWANPTPLAGRGYGYAEAPQDAAAPPPQPPNMTPLPQRASVAAPGPTPQAQPQQPDLAKMVEAQKGRQLSMKDFMEQWKAYMPEHKAMDPKMGLALMLMGLGSGMMQPAPRGYPGYPMAQGMNNAMQGLFGWQALSQADKKSQRDEMAKAMAAYPPYLAATAKEPGTDIFDAKGNYIGRSPVKVHGLPADKPTKRTWVADQSREGGGYWVEGDVKFPPKETITTVEYPDKTTKTFKGNYRQHKNDDGVTVIWDADNNKEVARFEKGEKVKIQTRERQPAYEKPPTYTETGRLDQINKKRAAQGQPPLTMGEYRQQEYSKPRQQPGGQRQPAADPKVMQYKQHKAQWDTQPDSPEKRKAIQQREERADQLWGPGVRP